MCSMPVPATKATRNCQGVSLSNKTQPQQNQRGDIVLKRLENTHLVWLALKAHIRFG